MEIPVNKSRFWIPLIIGSVIIIIILYNGWCTGDTSKPGNSVTLANLPDAESCYVAAEDWNTPALVQHLTAGLDVWATGQPCTAHAGCAVCRQVTTIDTSSADLMCVSDGQNRLNLVYHNFGYDLDCDCR